MEIETPIDRAENTTNDFCSVEEEAKRLGALAEIFTEENSIFSIDSYFTDRGNAYVSRAAAILSSSPRDKFKKFLKCNAVAISEYCQWVDLLSCYQFVKEVSVKTNPRSEQSWVSWRSLFLRLSTPAFYLNSLEDLYLNGKPMKRLALSIFISVLECALLFILNHSDRKDLYIHIETPLMTLPTSGFAHNVKYLAISKTGQEYPDTCIACHFMELSLIKNVDLGEVAYCTIRGDKHDHGILLQSFLMRLNPEKLKELTLMDSQLKEVPKPVERFTELRALNFACNPFEYIPEMCLPKLENLILLANPMLTGSNVSSKIAFQKNPRNYKLTLLADRSKEISEQPRYK